MKLSLLFVIILIFPINLLADDIDWSKLNEVDSHYFIEISVKGCTLTLWDISGEKPEIVKVYKAGTPKQSPYIHIPLGWCRITRIQFDPAWYPTQKIKEYFKSHKGIDLPDVVKPGDPENYMGSVKLTLDCKGPRGPIFRIHGCRAVDEKLVGTRCSSGCTRMKNAEGRELGKTVDVGTPVYIHM